MVSLLIKKLETKTGYDASFVEWMGRGMTDCRSGALLGACGNQQDAILKWPTVAYRGFEVLVLGVTLSPALSLKGEGAFWAA
ncbi:hypothetical protein UB43_08915 [Pseudomonas sp. 21]|nr:hypothetical protein UB43_08915 [Pseudomonas sp. 21]